MTVGLIGAIGAFCKEPDRFIKAMPTLCQGLRLVGVPIPRVEGAFMTTGNVMAAAPAFENGATLIRIFGRDAWEDPMGRTVYKVTSAALTMFSKAAECAQGLAKMGAIALSGSWSFALGSIKNGCAIPVDFWTIKGDWDKSTGDWGGRLVLCKSVAVLVLHVAGVAAVFFSFPVPSYVFPLMGACSTCTGGLGYFMKKSVEKL